METENPYWEEVLKLDRSPLGDSQELDGFGIKALMEGRYEGAPRERLVSTYAWAIPSPEGLDYIREELATKTVVELGAGTGYWAWMLTQLGLKVDAYDLKESKKWFHVQKGSIEQVAASECDVLMLCWPEGSMAAKALKVFKGEALLYIGEGPGGCTADDDFFEELRNWELAGIHPNISYGSIHDRIYVYRRPEVKP